MNESTFRLEVVRAINDHEVGWAFHPRPSAYGGAGLPDIIAGVVGKIIGIECKLVRRLPKINTTPVLSGYGFTPLQEATARSIERHGGGKTIGMINLRQEQLVAIVPISSVLNFSWKDVCDGRVRTIPWSAGKRHLTFLFSL